MKWFTKKSIFSIFWIKCINVYNKTFRTHSANITLRRAILELSQLRSSLVGWCLNKTMYFSSNCMTQMLSKCIWRVFSNSLKFALFQLQVHLKSAWSQLKDLSKKIVCHMLDGQTHNVTHWACIQAKNSPCSPLDQLVLDRAASVCEVLTVGVAHNHPLWTRGLVRSEINEN